MQNHGTVSARPLDHPDKKFGGSRLEAVSNTYLITSIIVVSVIAFVMALLHFDGKNFGPDDAYITYHFADNIARGYGFAFNPGSDPVLGTTTPLYTAILALGAILGADIPFLSIIIGALATAVGATLMVLLGKDEGLFAAGVAAAFTWVLSAATWTSLDGMETPFYIALILGSIWAARRGWTTAALIVSVATVLTRIDGLAVLAVVVIYIGIQHKLTWRAAAPAAVIMVTWLALAFYWFGSPIPTSGLAKMEHASEVSGSFSLLARRFADMAAPILQFIAPAQGRGVWALALMAVCSLALILSRKKAFLMLIPCFVLYAAGYLYIGLPNFAWYYGPFGAIACLTIWSGAQYGIESLTRNGKKSRHAGIGASLILIAAFGASVLSLPSQLGPQTTANDPAAQQQAGEWLRDHADPGDSVAAYEIGKVSYFSGLKTIDLLGLT